MTRRIKFSRRAEACLARLDRTTQERMVKAIRGIAEDPAGRGTKPLAGSPGGRAARVGGFRIVYSFDTGQDEVWIEAIGPRGQVYRDL